MIAPKYRQAAILSLSALFLIALSSLITFFASQSINSSRTADANTKRALGVVTNRPKFDAFAGTGVCQNAIKTGVAGKIITMHLDARSARYDDFERTNTLLFILDVVPEGQQFLSEQLSTTNLHAQCITSADDNRLVNLIVAPASEL